MENPKTCFFNIKPYRELQDSYQEQEQYNQLLGAPKLSLGLLQRLESRAHIFSRSNSDMDSNDQSDLESN